MSPPEHNPSPARPPRPLRAAPRAPRAKLAIPGDSRYLVHFSPGAPWDGAAYVAFLADAPAKVLAGAKVLDADGALVVRRSLVEAALAPWVASGYLVLRPVVVAPIKEPNQPKFDKPAADHDFVIIDPLVEVAPDRRSLAEYSFFWSQDRAKSGAVGPLPGSRERALLTSFDRSPFDGDRVPVEPIFRCNELTLDVWVGPEVEAALRGALGDAIVEGRTRPSPAFVPAPDFTPLPGSDADAEAAAEAYFAGVRSGAVASPRGPSKLAKAERHRVLRSPRYAYLLARREGPGDDTRDAALGHPYYALAYAREVDRSPRDDTREAAAATVESAILYATDVDRAAHPVTRARLEGSYRLSDYDERLARLVAITSGQAAALARLGVSEPARAAEPIDGARIAGGNKPAHGTKPAHGAQLDAPVRGTASQGAATKVAVPRFHVVVLKGFVEASVGVPFAPGGEPAWGLELRDGDVRVTLPATKEGARIAKSLPSVACFAAAATGPWVLRRERAVELFAGVTGVELRRVVVERRGEALAGDYVLVDVTAERPLDRDVAKASFSDPARPWSSVVRAASELSVLGLGGDSLTLARVSELPSLCVASEALVARWKKLKAPFGVAKPPHAHLRPMPVFPVWDEGPPFPPTQAGGDVLRAALAGESAARAEALENPLFAYFVARLVDRAPSKETRAAALGHPHAAALYARFVDGEARTDTRAAVSSCAPAALFYARFVDEKLHPRLADALVARGYGEDGVAELRGELEALRTARARS